MTYIVTFYAFWAGLGETVITTHSVDGSAIGAYTDDPGLTLMAVRRVGSGPRVDGFRVTDEAGLVLLDHSDQNSQT